MSQQKANPFKPMLVIDFLCDHCGEKIRAVIVARMGTQKKIARSYHAECWEKYVLPTQDFHKPGAN